MSRYELGQDGRPLNVPFYVDYTFQDYGENEETYVAYLDSLSSQYEMEFRHARPGQPLRSQYPEGVPGDQGYNADIQTWAIQNGVTQAMKSLQPPPPPLGRPPDEHAVKRQAWVIWEKDCLEKAQAAEERGDLREAAAHRERARWAPEELKKIPKPWGQEMLEKIDFEIVRESLGLLFDPKVKDHEIWEIERMRHDAEVSLHEFNKRTDGLTILLTKETAPHSREYLPVRPGNVIKFEFPDESTKKSFLYQVYQVGLDPSATLKGMGYGYPVEQEEAPLEMTEASPEETKPEEGPWGTGQDAFNTWRTTGKKPEAPEDQQQKVSQSEGEFEASLQKVG